MARHNRKQEPGSAWGALLGVPLMLGFGYYVAGDGVPLVNGLTMSASERAEIERSVTYSGCNEVSGSARRRSTQVNRATATTWTVTATGSPARTTDAAPGCPVPKPAYLELVEGLPFSPRGRARGTKTKDNASTGSA